MSRSSIKLALLTLVLLFLIVASIQLGRYPIRGDQLVRMLFSKLFPIEMTWTETMETVLFNIRLPRVLLAGIVGSCLSLAGASYQGVFQNPMASPDLLGATSGAAFGAALAILLGASSFMISISAFSFSIVTVAIVFLIGKKAPGSPLLNLILSGIMVSALFTAGTSYIKLVADPTNQLPSITYWLMGSFSGARFYEVQFIALPMLIGGIPLLVLRWRLNLLTLGDDTCQSMGIDPHKLRFIVIVASTILTAASVAVSGMIGWVGLVVPHLCRKLVGSNYKYLMPASMIVGASFMLIVDTVSRNLLEVEIPMGILTAFIGTPFFIYLIFKHEEDRS